MARPGLLCAGTVLPQHASPAPLPCSCTAPEQCASQKGTAGYLFSCVSKLTRTVNRVKGEFMCECLSFRALVPKMWVQNSLSHQTMAFRDCSAALGLQLLHVPACPGETQGFSLTCHSNGKHKWHSEGLCTYSLKGEVKYLMFLFPSQWKVGK